MNFLKNTADGPRAFNLFPGAKSKIFPANKTARAMEQDTIDSSPVPAKKNFSVCLFPWRDWRDAVGYTKSITRT
jgi:hypothetical protein